MPSSTQSQSAHGIFDLIAQSGPMAQFVLFILLMSSIICWAIIFIKWKNIRFAIKQNEKFLTTFWNSKSIEEISNKNEKIIHSPIGSIFQFGIKEFKKFPSDLQLSGKDTFHLEKIDTISRALNRATRSEIKSLEKHLHWLATTASAAPFVGLFGTVWGVMNSFQSIGLTGAANLAVVAPGISEALITTATGIGTAIPAVIAYNYFSGLVKTIAIDMDCFSQDFINIIQRNFMNQSVNQNALPPKKGI